MIIAFWIMRFICVLAVVLSFVCMVDASTAGEIANVVLAGLCGIASCVTVTVLESIID